MAAKTTARNISANQIWNLLIEAGQAGDSALVRTCQRALAGSENARKQVAKVLATSEAAGWCDERAHYRAY